MQRRLIIRAPIRLSASPSLTITLIGKVPVLNIMVLGAVATGNINAQLALIAAGTISTSGGILAAKAAAAKIGSINVVVAVLLVISVINVMVKQIPSTRKKVSRVASCVSHAPSSAESPEERNAFAIAIPPPNKMSMPQGIFSAASQLRRRSPLPLGMRNMVTTANRAMLASLTLGTESKLDQPP